MTRKEPLTANDRESVRGLRIPADMARPVALPVLRLTAPELSDAIGGGLLEEVLTTSRGESGYTFYLDMDRVPKGMPSNERAATLAARLGHANQATLADLRGDVLVLGCDRWLNDMNVPPFVVEAAVHSGLVTELAVSSTNARMLPDQPERDSRET